VVKTLTLRREWLEPGYVPDSLYEAPFEEMTNRPFFGDVADAEVDHSPYGFSIESFAADLVSVLDQQLDALYGPVHCLLSGGYDSRILAFLLEDFGIEPLYVTDGTEEPECGATLDLLGVPDERRHVYDLDQPDPYGLVDAECEGFAPLYSQMRFFPADPAAVLVTGLGGGEWFSYPAGGWHRGKKQRLPHTNLVNQWLDCWPQYTLLPDAWRRGYRDSLNPYCTPEYARVAARCRPEWLVEVNSAKGLDMVREAMLDSLDSRLAGLGWVPHDYDWHLNDADRDRIDDRYAGSWLARTFGLGGRPSSMDRDDHACTLAGFATWCDRLIGRGYAIS
jgi:hypothetical protein